MAATLTTTDTTFALPTDDDERAELAKVGIDLNAPMGDAQLDAAASHILGLMADCDKDIARYVEAQAAEVARITMRYEASARPIQERRQRLEAIVLDIAQRADYGKKKSRSVGNGVYGKRTTPARVEILDEASALAIAKTVEGGVKIKESVVHKVVAAHVVNILEATGEIPEGFEHYAEKETYYAKPEVA